MNDIAAWRDLIRTVLTESVELEEARIDTLRSKYVPLVRAALPNLRMPAGVKSRAEKMPGQDDAERLFNWIAGQDPGKNNAYTQWMLDRILRQSRPMPLEDVIYAPETLANYEKVKRDLAPDQRDINRFVDLSSVRAATASRQDTAAQSDAEEEERARRESKVLYDKGDYIVVAPDTMFAAQYWGRGSDWCTAYGDPKGNWPDRTENAFDDYYDQPGDIVIIRSRKNGPLYQIASDEAKDAEDLDVALMDVLDAVPMIAQVPAAMKHMPASIRLASKDGSYKFLIDLGEGEETDGPMVILCAGDDIVTWKPWVTEIHDDLGEWLLRHQELPLEKWTDAMATRIARVNPYAWTGSGEAEPTVKEISAEILRNMTDAIKKARKARKRLRGSGPPA